MSIHIGRTVPDRRDAKPITLKFGPGQQSVQMIDVTHPVYAAWLKNKPLLGVLIKDEPSFLDKPGASDPRRKIVSLNECDWAKGPKILKIRIQESGIKVDTPPRQQ